VCGPRKSQGSRSPGAHARIAPNRGGPRCESASTRRKLRDGGIGTYIRNLLTVFFGASRGPRVRGLLARGRTWGALPRKGFAGAKTSRSGRGSIRSPSNWLLAARGPGAPMSISTTRRTTRSPSRSNVPAVVTVHDLIHVRFARFFPAGGGHLRPAPSRAPRCARAAHRPSGFEPTCARNVREILGVSTDRGAAVVPLGISKEFTRRPAADFGALPQGAKAPVPPTFSTSGREKKHKNLALLIDALERLPRFGAAPRSCSPVRAWRARPSTSPKRAIHRRRLQLHPLLGAPARRERAGPPLLGGRASTSSPRWTRDSGSRRSRPWPAAPRCSPPRRERSRKTLGEAAVLLPPSEPEGLGRGHDRIAAEQPAPRGSHPPWDRAVAWVHVGRRTAPAHDGSVRRGSGR